MTPETTFELKEKVATLQAQLLEAHPRMPILLKEIHTLLTKDPEVVTLLTEDEIGILVNGLKVQTRTEITTKPEKKETAASMIKKALAASKSSGGSVADLF